MKARWQIGLAAALGLFAAHLAIAGDEEHGSERQLYWIMKAAVKPSMASEYEKELRFMIDEFQKYEIDPDKMHWETIAGPELGYVYVVKLENFGTMDQLHQDWMAAVMKIGQEKFAESEARSAACVDHRESFHVMYRPDLSYEPEDPRVDHDEVTFIHYSFYYPFAGKERDLEQFGMKYRELAARNGLRNGWRVFQSLTGADLPLYVVVQPARSQADFFTQIEDDREVFGEEGEALDQKIVKVIRKMEERQGWLRPDLSYPPK